MRKFACHPHRILYVFKVTIATISFFNKGFWSTHLEGEKNVNKFIAAENLPKSAGCRLSKAPSDKYPK
ncbi:MAG: hypothetical protein NPIRA06_00770 [Nitrospirales bacterium]|nr:MAG: hypothetical protein NPIRA06_00770 [Nitrospirales bacterium]